MIYSAVYAVSVLFFLVAASKDTLTASFTYYNSYAACCKDNPNYDPNAPTDECDNYSACKYSGDFAAIGHQSYEYVESNNLVAFYDDNYPDYDDFMSRYAKKTIRLTYTDSNGKKTKFDALIADTCGNNDCNGCCQRNSGVGGYLVDLEYNTVVNNFGKDFEIFEKGVLKIEFEIIGGMEPAPLPPNCDETVALYQNCQESANCCPAQQTCFEKNQYWAQCLSNCEPGIHKSDPEEYQTPWSCKKLGDNDDKPTPKPTLPGGAKPSIIFRLDDVQDWYLNTNVKEILAAFNARNLPLSIGVIGGKYYGDDPSLHKAIVDAVENHGSEVFNHGDDASTFFNAIDKDAAKQHIKNAEEDGFTYKSFVPHQNRWNDATLKALEELGYKVISASKGGSFPMPARLDKGKLKLMPQHTETAEYAGGAWETRVDTIMDDCTKAMKDDGFCVVMMHPQEFAKGSVTVQSLADLLDEIKKDTNWKVTTFRTFADKIDNVSGGKPTPEPTKSPTQTNKYYANWDLSACVNDGNNPTWAEVHDTLTACCAKHFEWKKDECAKGASIKPTAEPIPTPKPTNKVSTPAPTTTPSDSLMEVYKAFCADLEEKQPCKKPCSWKKNRCQAKAQKKVKCKKMPKNSSICELLGCTLKKKGKCSGSIDWSK